MADALPSILSPKNDFVFKRIFGDANHIAPLSGFLQAALGLPEDELAGITVIDPNLNPRYDGDKHCILDVCITTRSGREVDVEIQLEPSRELLDRIQYYTARMVTDKVQSGKKYRDMPQSISIVVMDFPEWKDARYHHRFRLYDAEAELPYPNSLEIHTLELPKRPAESDGTGLWDWLAFLSSKTREEFDSLAGKGAAMAEAVARLKEMSADERERRLADARAKWQWDEAARIRQKRDEGREEAQDTIARNLLKMKRMSLAEIAGATGLSEAEIERLAVEEKA